MVIYKIIFGEDMVKYLARFLDITMNNFTLPVDCKRAILFPVRRGLIDH
jgi:hypothetical protein